VGVGELAPNSRGYNLVALDRLGATLDQVVFDTFADPEASKALVKWVDALPAGTVVLGAVKDEASGQLATEAVRALGTLGVSGDLRGRFRESHAFIGVKGAPVGSAVEALGRRAVEVRVGRPEVEFAVELVAFELRPLTPAGARR
jgi:Interleukin-like EMT inducer